MSIFEKKNLKPQNVFQKLFKILPKKNFPIELENYLSDYENSLESVAGNKAKELASKYKINLENDFVEERKDILQKYFYEKKENCSYSEIKHFANILNLSQSDFDSIYQLLISSFYESKVKSYLSENILQNSEKLALKDFQNRLKIPTDTANSIYKNAVKSTMDSYIKPIFESEIYSPTDEEKLFNVAKNLGLNLTFPEEVQQKLQKYRENWEISNGKLPILQTDIRLQNGELLHFKTFINWMEERTVTKRVNYSGITYSKKIIGNVRWKIGTIVPNRIQTNELQHIDSGYVYFTNKRIIFNGQHENKVIPISKILNFQPYTDGILIEKETGKSPFLAFNQDIENAATILARILS